MDAYAPIKGKCVWWRELPNEDDKHDIMIKAPDKRIACTCGTKSFQASLSVPRRRSKTVPGAHKSEHNRKPPSQPIVKLPDPAPQWNT